jgi:DNA polymerase III epsilon subunit-like protein
MIATIFDTETTNLIDNHVVKMDRQPYLLEFYGCHVDLRTGETLRELEHLIRPPEEKCIDVVIAKKSHGITWDLVKDKPEFKEVADEIIQFIGVEDTIIAHNLAFDMEMMDIEAERLGSKIEWPERKICTIEQTTWLKGKWLSLEDLHEHLFGMKFMGAHRAKTDVLALVRCCIEMYRREWI